MTAQEKANALRAGMEQTMLPIVIPGASDVALLRPTRFDFGRHKDPEDTRVYVRVMLEVVLVDDPLIVTPN
jgi:hypothetical protein